MRHLGGVAQLGEHLLCKQGVTGSIPVVSISVCAVGVTAVSRSFRVRWMRVSGHRVPDGCARRGVGLCQCESGSGASLDACARPGSGAMACVSMTRQSACSPRVMARCSMACLTGKCVPCGMAAPVIGGEGSEALCERLIGSGGSGAARAVAEMPGSKQSCYVRESDTAGSSNRGANLV
jgi:hypothetical protein